MLDSRGRVIGINTAMIYMAQGISFSVPINTARWVISELVTRGKVRRAYLGLGAQTRPIGRRTQRYFELSAKSAVEVISLEDNGPAKRAGLQEKDLVVALAGEPVATVDDIHRRLADKPAGAPVMLTVLRGTERHERSIVREVSHGSVGAEVTPPQDRGDDARPPGMSASKFDDDSEALVIGEETLLRCESVLRLSYFWIQLHVFVQRSQRDASGGRARPRQR